MSKLANLTPDTVLASLLDKVVTVQTSETESHSIRAYADEGKPNVGLGNEFVEVAWNGSARSLTSPLGVFRGYLALSIYVKAQTDGRAKKKLVRQIIAQCEELVNGKTSQGFFFKLDPTNAITPTTVNPTTGYSTTVLNVKWHVTDEFINN